MGDLNLEALDQFGFVDPAKSLIKKPEITLNKNFYPDILVADESKEKEQVEILEAELNKKQ